MCAKVEFNLYNILSSMTKYLIKNIGSYGLSQLPMYFLDY